MLHHTFCTVLLHSCCVPWGRGSGGHWSCYGRTALGMCRSSTAVCVWAVAWPLSGSHQASLGLRRGGRRGPTLHPGGNERGKVTQSPLTSLPLHCHSERPQEPCRQHVCLSKGPPSACFKYLTVAHLKVHTAHTVVLSDDLDGRNEPAVCQNEHFLFVWHMTK